MSAPNTVTEAVALLRDKGYDEDIEIESGDASCTRAGARLSLTAVVVEHTYRFEGDSDPGDEAIVLGLRFPDTGVRGVLVSAFGADAEP
ncbi:MAG TPA: hypothetical protein VGM78_00525, partial [Ilumatobacteraceae bacterium]